MKAADLVVFAKTIWAQGRGGDYAWRRGIGEWLVKRAKKMGLPVATVCVMTPCWTNNVLAGLEPLGPSWEESRKIAEELAR